MLFAFARSGGAMAPLLPESVPEILVEAQEPQFVAPSRRDRIGRIWAPVMINGRGPLRFVLDTGASRSAITAPAAELLGLEPDPSRSVLLRGVTGSLRVPTICVNSLSVGDLIVAPAVLPVVTDALGGAQGVLGMEHFGDMRILIDFRHDLITIAHSHAERARADFVTIPVERSAAGLLMVRAVAAGVRIHAIIDTGAQATIGNEAMREALVRRHSHGTPDQVIDVTAESQNGESFRSPPIAFGSIEIRGARITYGDMHIFAYWQLLQKPALLIGMDALGLLDELVIDYRRHELQLRTRSDSG